MASHDDPQSLCHYCNGRIPEGKDVDLWDGSAYCEDCVESVCAGLSEYARAEPCIEEELPVDRHTVCIRALIPAGVVAVLLIIRTCLEDITLQRELTGYADYARRVRFRLVPGIW